MKHFSIINRYIFKGLFPPFIISLFFLTFVFLMTRIPDITNMVINYDTRLLSIAMLVVYSVPRFLEFTIPMSVMIAVLITFTRMSGDNEILALRSSGISLYKLLPPVMAFCMTGVMLTLWVTVSGVAWGKLSFRTKSIELARAGIDLALQERQFNLNIEDIMIYVNALDMNTREMTDIFIEDRRTKDLVSISTAPSGQVFSDTDRMIYTLRLYDGSINQVNITSGAVNTIRFTTYDINIDPGPMINKPGPAGKDMDEKNLTELFTMVRTGKEVLAGQDRNRALLQIHEKFAVPFACLFLGFLAFPLGIRSVSRKTSTGFGLGILFFLLYYLLLAAGWSLSETGRYPPVLGMWLPNLITGAAGVFLLNKHAQK